MSELIASQREQVGDLSADRDVCIVGAGFSGLAAASALRRRDVAFTCVESAAGVGGIWRYSDGGESISSPSYRGLHLNTSRAVTGYTGFPMPDSYPRYPDLRQVAAYLEGFADHIGIRDDLELNTDVIAIEPAPDRSWNVITRDRATGTDRRRRFRQVIVAAGYHHTPQLPAIPGAASFPGRQLHSIEYVDPRDLAGHRVLVLGFGNSACDIAVETSHVADRTVLAIRHGAHVVPKQLMGIPIDEIAASRWWSWLPFRVQRRFVECLLWLIRGSITSYGLPRPNHRIFSAPITISDDLLSRITHGAISVKPMIERFRGSEAEFVDGSREDFDTVIYCTGYDFSFPFLPGDCVVGADGRLALYRRVVPPRYPGVYVVGLIRPVGAITRVVEAQAEWVADLIEGVAALPPEPEMWREIDGYLAGAARRYGTAVRDSIHVDVARYLRSVRREREEGRRRRREEVLR
ncbi:flavin-containing monooxygenase [Gandjariella thermophila]|uniref:4-hydroxybenzoate brominase (decarboxylating) n=1 Tax=Gandjariella thermophila TaxID=1931992 RepID=A0A4D4J3G4_9PSEU|nr:NAD(P)-binding domain-containing protein [Gandjariella thermophila]GDY28537.1 flavin-binding monooxygenase [Gandjariella thermophila]